MTRLTIDCDRNVIEAYVDTPAVWGRKAAVTGRSMLIAGLLRPRVRELMKLPTAELQKRYLKLLRAGTL